MFIIKILLYCKFSCPTAHCASERTAEATVWQTEVDSHKHTDMATLDMVCFHRVQVLPGEEQMWSKVLIISVPSLPMLDCQLNSLSVCVNVWFFSVGTADSDVTDRYEQPHLSTYPTEHSLEIRLNEM